MIKLEPTSKSVLRFSFYRILRGDMLAELTEVGFNMCYESVKLLKNSYERKFLRGKWMICGLELIIE